MTLSSDSTQYDADVVVIGFGPVGVTVANALGRLGVKTVVLERDREIYPRARAVTVNDWTLRIFQQFGLDAELIVDMVDSGELHWRTYAGREVFALEQSASGIGHPGSMMIYQPAMEAALRRGATRFAETVDIRFGCAMTGIEQDPDGVTVSVADVGTNATSTVHARYALACDGGSSLTRAALGVELVGSTLETEWIVIDGEVKKWWAGCQDLVFWSDPERPVVDIPLSLGYHRWEFPLRPGEKRSDFDSPDAIWRLLEPMGRTPEEVEVRQHAFYVHHVRHAATWRVGRTMLLGDAAHMMPPWAGQGMQSGIRDAHNVAWKLHAVLAGQLDDSVLDTYETERAPNVADMTTTSGKLGAMISSRDKKFVFLRDNLGPILKHVPLARKALASGKGPSIESGWLTGRPAKKSALGRMLPQPPVSTARARRVRLDDHLGSGFAVIGWDVDPRTVMSVDDQRGWELLGARFIAVRPPHGSAQDDTDLIDHTGVLGSWFARHRTSVVVVRPDFFVAASEPTGLGTPTQVFESSSASTEPSSTVVSILGHQRDTTLTNS